MKNPCLSDVILSPRRADKIRSAAQLYTGNEFNKKTVQREDLQRRKLKFFLSSFETIDNFGGIVILPIGIMAISRSSRRFE